MDGRGRRQAERAGDFVQRLCEEFAVGEAECGAGRRGRAREVDADLRSRRLDW